MTPSQVHNTQVEKSGSSSALRQARAQLLFAATQANIEPCEASINRNNEIRSPCEATMEAFP